jgi:hypothetical protein
MLQRVVDLRTLSPISVDLPVTKPVLLDRLVYQTKLRLILFITVLISSSSKINLLFRMVGSMSGNA